MKKKSFAYPVFFMILITAIYTFALSTINLVTAERIEEQSQLRRRNALAYVVDLEAENQSEILKFYEEMIRENNRYIFQSNDDKVYIYEFTGNGLWGEIRGFLAVNDELTDVVGVEFLSHSETPGLGGRIDEVPFKEQFRGISLENENPFQVIDTIAGATSTSNAVIQILNESFDAISSQKGGGK